MGIRDKVKSPAALKRILGRLRRPAGAGKRAPAVVFTNGCFDVLHPGHVRYLERAARLGSILVVALNDDASVRALKGPSRPVNPLPGRMEVVAALESVTYVTSFGGPDPRRLIVSLAPNVLVKGGDWPAGKIVGATEVLASGGKVLSLPFHRGHSTTAILRRSRGRPA